MWSGQIRDPDRIDRILKKLETYWKQKNHTDLRLTQIIVNMTNTKRNSDIFDIKFNVINHRSLLKVLLNPFLRILGKQIATDFDERNGFLRKIILTKCPKQFKFYI